VTDDWVDGKFLPKGSMVIINAWGMQHDPKKFKSPEVFDPDHYTSYGMALAPELAASADYEKRDHWGYGSGRRLCTSSRIHYLICRSDMNQVRASILLNATCFWPWLSCCGLSHSNLGRMRLKRLLSLILTRLRVIVRDFWSVQMTSYVISSLDLRRDGRLL
jgi:hypothetical protein